eukprot:2858252-Pyramimonas_sp.AAC.3
MRRGLIYSLYSRNSLHGTLNATSRQFRNSKSVWFQTARKRLVPNTQKRLVPNVTNVSGSKQRLHHEACAHRTGASPPAVATSPPQPAAPAPSYWSADASASPPRPCAAPRGPRRIPTKEWGRTKWPGQVTSPRALRC